MYTNAEIVTIEKIEPMDPLNYENDITVRKNNKTLYCFAPDLMIKGPFYLDLPINVCFSLMTTRLEEQNSKEKKITSERRRGTPNHCTLSGEIKEILPVKFEYFDETTESFSIEKNHTYRHGIVDCGPRVAVELLNNSHLSIGDFVYAEGRLDISAARELFPLKIGIVDIGVFITDYAKRCILTGLHDYSFPCRGSDYFGIPKERFEGLLWLETRISKKITTKEKHFNRAEGGHLICKGEVENILPVPKETMGSCYIEPLFDQRQYGIIDCGMHVITLLPDPSPFNIGDHVLAIGRVCLMRSSTK